MPRALSPNQHGAICHILDCGVCSATVYADGSWAKPSATLANGNNTYTATAVDTYSRTATDSLTVSLPSTVTFQYDGNGNLTNDGRRVFEYDYENQLTNVYVASTWRSESKYDAFGRRKVRKDYGWSGSAWKLTNEVRYVYDGMLVVQERDTNNIALVSYTRGNDLSGSLQGAGGIGGLLARTENGRLAVGDAGAHAYYHADGNGNVTAMVNTNGIIVARYNYDPYGNLLGMAGPLAEANTYRFSSKEYLLNAGLYYYGFRFYEPNAQRWLNRDPIGERGGVNLFEFADTDPANTIDSWGHEGGFCSNDDGARNAGRDGHDGKKNSDKHSNAESHGGKKSKPNMAGTPPTSAQKEAINADKVKKGQIPDPNAPMKNKGPKKKISGHADPRLLGKVVLVGAEAMCAAAYNKCLNVAENANNNQLDAAMAGGCYSDRQAAIDNAMDVYYLSAAECATKYAICGLSALLPF